MLGAKTMRGGARDEGQLAARAREHRRADRSHALVADRCACNDIHSTMQSCDAGAEVRSCDDAAQLGRRDGSDMLCYMMCYAMLYDVRCYAI